VTTPNLAAPLSVADLESASEAVRRQGLRLTSARRLVLEVLARAGRPLRAEEIAGGAGDVPASDIASVYRNLETLERIGVVRHMHHGHGPGLYALAGLEDGEFLVCEKCGTSRPVDSGELDEVRALVRERFGFEARFSHFPLFGLCERCSAS
jgi:Fur family transcriptional regulator, ferric uptake regulator